METKGSGICNETKGIYTLKSLSLLEISGTRFFLYWKWQQNEWMQMFGIFFDNSRYMLLCNIELKIVHVTVYNTS